MGPMKMLLSAALLFVLTEFTRVEGSEYNSTRLIQVKVFEKEEAEFCVRPLSEKPKKVKLALRLRVKSTAKEVFSAGNSSIAHFTPNRWNKVTIYHAIAHHVHILDVTVDGRSIPFKKSTERDFLNTAYNFKEITLLSMGNVQITDCPSPNKAPTTASTRKTTTKTRIITTIATIRSPRVIHAITEEKMTVKPTLPTYDKNANTPRLEKVLVSEERTKIVCIRPESGSSEEVELVVQMMVNSRITNERLQGGNATLVGLMPNTLYRISISHKIEPKNFVHVLDVQMDEKPVDFKKSERMMFESAYSFAGFLLLSTGNVLLSDCPSSQKTSTVLPTPEIHVLREPSVNASTATDIPGAGTSWRQFIYCLGDFKGFPVLVMLILAFILGLVIASVATIICERSCCSRRPKRVSSSLRQSLRADYIHPESTSQDALYQPTSHRNSNNLYSSLPNRQYNHQERTPRDNLLPPTYYETRNDMYIEHLHGENMRLESNQQHPTFTSTYNGAQNQSLYDSPPDLTRVCSR